MTRAENPDPEAGPLANAAWGWMTALRKAGLDKQTSALALASAAAKFWAERSGRPLPDRLLSDSADLPDIPAAVTREQDEMLASLNDVAASEYLRTIAQVFGMPAPENLTTASLTRIAIAALMSRAPKQPGDVNILDLAAGSASLLLAAGKAVCDREGTPRLLAQDLNPAATSFAAANLFTSGLTGEVRTCNSLTVDAFPADQAALALSVPPIGASWEIWRSEIKALHRSEGWYRFGLPPTSDSSWLFASRLIEKLRAPEDGGGRALTFVATSTASTTRGDATRRALIEADLIEAIIALPSGLHGLTQLPLTALVLTNKKSPKLEGRVQIVDLRSYFKTDKGKDGAKRVMSSAGEEMLVRSLGVTKDGPVSRTLSNERLLSRSAKIRRRAEVQQAESEVSAELLTWKVQLPVDSDSEEYLRQRYASVEVVADAELEAPSSNLDVSAFFDSKDQVLKRQLLEQGWEATRLSALLIEPPALVQDRLNSLTDNTVILPTGRGDASTAENDEAATGTGRRLALDVDPEYLSSKFLAGWLNSRAGVDSRLRAIQAAGTGNHFSAVRSDQQSLWRLADEILVPIPTLDNQRRIAAGQTRLDAVAGMLAETRQELWASADVSAQLLGRFDPLLDDSFAGWSNELPFPVASALRSLEAERGNIHATHKQAFRVWEAYSAFWSTVLISALGADAKSRSGELESVRSALAKQGLSMERASMGGWGIIIQRLSKYFRDLLRGDDQEEQARVLQAFGSPPPSALAQLLDEAVVGLISEASSKRNSWDGHSATQHNVELESQLSQMDDLLRSLQGAVASAWSELPMVRAGDGYLNQGQVVQSVELLTGPTTPFIQREFLVGELLQKGGLYLAVDDAVQPLRLQPYFILRTGPDNIQNTCYFYNRIEGDGVRMVSYHLSGYGEFTEPLEYVREAASELIG